MPETFHAFVLAGTHSGAGKTLWSLALAKLAQTRGLTVQPFKAGPDYIDPSFHDAVSAPRKSRNLDFHLMTPDIIRETFARHTAGADLALIEGVMGLFDGKRGEDGSTAKLAKFLSLPVFLVIDGAGMASSAAAIALGFRDYDPKLKLAGIFFNRVNTQSHFEWLKESVESRTGIPCLGYLPADETLKIPERHLGLMTAGECGNARAVAEKAAALLESRIDWDRVMKASATPDLSFRRAQRGEIPGDFSATPRNDRFSNRIGVALDAAFSFYYEDNFDLLRAAGAELVFFSPLKDKALPSGLDLIYLGGGFPEIYAGQLASNHDMISAVRGFYQGGGFIYAECGGFIYLTEAFHSGAGEKFPLVGLTPGTVRMTQTLQNFGYKDLEVIADNFLFARGTRLHSHEFHYSAWDGSEPDRPVYKTGQRSDGYAAPRLVASYQHLHFAACTGLAERMARLRRTELSHA